MAHSRKPRLLAGGLLATAMFLAIAAQSARSGDFTAFAEDEDVCRHTGAAAIKGAAGPSAAQRYDFAHRKCMIAHGRMRQMNAYADSDPPGYPVGNPHSFEYPDAFYSIPYATPGYGYDGFSY